MRRVPFLRASFAPGELVVDSFAGGGGASTGIESALGRPVDIAINHDAEAIAMHAANHPETKHYVEDIWQVDPREACGTRPVALAWFSPACTHFSRAKGAANPLCEKIRGLAWVVVRWAKAVRPRTIVLENVEEFTTWGPLRDDGRPYPGAAGETYRAWLAELAALGYRIETRSLVAADYGAPTTRRRFYLVATLDAGSIAWPEPTHGKGRAEAWRTAAEVIDWSLPCPSIFGRARPLAEATLKRIAIGIRRYVLDAAQPFVLPVTHGSDRAHGVDQPLRTITAAHRGEMALVEPFVVRHGHYSTLTGAGLREGCGAGVFRGQPLSDPLATVCATNDKHLVAPIVTKHYGGMVGHRVDRVLGTVTAKDHHALTAAVLGRADARAEVRAFLIKYYSAGGRSDQAAPVQLPLGTVTTRDRFGLGIVMLAGEPWQIVDVGMRMLQPHELFAAQGFPGDYEIRPEHNGKPLTKTAQTRLVGNSVCPPVAEAIVSAQVAARRAA